MPMRRRTQPLRSNNALHRAGTKPCTTACAKLSCRVSRRCSPICGALVVSTGHPQRRWRKRSRSPVRAAEPRRSATPPSQPRANAPREWGSCRAPVRAGWVSTPPTEATARAHTHPRGKRQVGHCKCERVLQRSAHIKRQVELGSCVRQGADTQNPAVQAASPIHEPVTSTNATPTGLPKRSES